MHYIPPEHIPCDNHEQTADQKFEKKMKKMSEFWNLVTICDTIKGNESLVEMFNFYFLTPLSS